MRILIFIAVLALLLPGCSGKGADGPVAPDMSNDNPVLTGASDNYTSGQAGSGGKALWGMWDVTVDRLNGVEIVPLRGLEYSVNVNSFLQPPMGTFENLQINVIDMEKLFIAGDVVVDVTLSHPFPDYSQFTGFDVLGVLIGTGSYVANSDSGIIFGNPRFDPILKNADGYTRWMNQMEFTTPGILGYTEGMLGAKGEFWGSTLNPYKYFVTGLSTTETITQHYTSGMSINDRGMFTTNASVTRRYEIHFPMIGGMPYVHFQYAVVASWVEPIHTPPVSLPGDFPISANMQESFHCDISTVGSTLYWNNMYDNGGDLFLTLEIFDWQGMNNPMGIAGEIKQIILDSPDEFINGGSKMVFGPGDWTELEGSCANSVKLAIDAGEVQPGGPCPFDNDVLVTIVTFEEGNYDSGLHSAYPTSAVLSGYARLFYDMGNVCNDPPILWFDNCPVHTLPVANRTFRWDAEDDVTPNNQLQYRYRYDSEPWTDWETNLKQVNFEDMTEETHTLRVECMDYDGQVSQAICTFTVDLPPEPQPPTIEFTNCATYVRETPHLFQWAISDDNTSVSNMIVRYNYDGGGWTPLSDGSTSVSIGGLTSGGPHQLIVEVEDHDGMIGQDMCEFDVNFAPTVTIDNCPGQDINVIDYTFNWTGVDTEMDPLQYQTKVDTNPWSAWGTTNSLDLLGLASGNHTLLVRVQDSVGGTNQTQCNFAVNLAPTITITNKPTQDVNATSYNFLWNSSDDLDSPLTLEYNVELDGVWQGWVAGLTGYDWNPLSSGPHTIRVRVRDSGNPALTDEDICNFTVNFPPSVSIDNCPPGLWGSTDITFDWTGTDDNTPEGGMEYQYQLDTDPWSPWSLGQLSVKLVGLSEGDHTISVRVRDMGNPQLTCVGPPDTCDSCTFTIDTSCSVPPADVQNFSATDGLATLNNREVELTWTEIAGCVNYYDIEKYEYDEISETWSWNLVQTLGAPASSWLDTDARYCGPVNPISYRIKARNAAGSSTNWGTDTGYPKLRQVKMTLWCVRDDSGGNPATTWPRGFADYTDCNTFWNQYGVNFEAQNPVGDFLYIDSTAFLDLTGSEDQIMHTANGQIQFPDAINVYYVRSSEGNYSRGYCSVRCPETDHNTYRIFIVLCRDTRGVPPSENPIVLAHECGHGMSRYWDQYLLDLNHNLILDDGATCAANNTWCPALPLYCNDNASYPENPGASTKVPKQLMWYSFVGAPISDYDIHESQWYWTDYWLTNYDANYPYP